MKKRVVILLGIILAGGILLWKTLFVCSSKLEHFTKKNNGVATWKSIEGKEHSSALYELSKIHCGHLKFNHVPVASRVCEADEKSIGFIEWPFHQSSLLLDFPR